MTWIAPAEEADSNSAAVNIARYAAPTLLRGGERVIGVRNPGHTGNEISSGPISAPAVVTHRAPTMRPSSQAAVQESPARSRAATISSVYGTSIPR